MHNIDVNAYFKPKEKIDFMDYMVKRIAHLTNGTSHWHRIGEARDKWQWANFQIYNPLKKISRSDHAVPFEDPYNGNAPLKILHPSPNTMAELRYGGIHPPVAAIIERRLLMVNSDGSGDVVEAHAALAYRQRHDVASEYVVDNRRAHDEVMGALEYEEALEWLIQKDVPAEIWSVKHNKPKMAIVPKSAIPTNRTHRNSWRLKDLAV